MSRAEAADTADKLWQLARFSALEVFSKGSRLLYFAVSRSKGEQERRKKRSPRDEACPSSFHRSYKMRTTLRSIRRLLAAFFLVVLSFLGLCFPGLLHHKTKLQCHSTVQVRLEYSLG